MLLSSLGRISGTTTTRLFFCLCDCRWEHPIHPRRIQHLGSRQRVHPILLSGSHTELEYIEPPMDRGDYRRSLSTTAQSLLSFNIVFTTSQGVEFLGHEQVACLLCGVSPGHQQMGGYAHTAYPATCRCESVQSGHWSDDRSYLYPWRREQRHACLRSLIQKIDHCCNATRERTFGLEYVYVCMEQYEEILFPFWWYAVPRTAVPLWVHAGKRYLGSTGTCPVDLFDMTTMSLFTCTLEFTLTASPLSLSHLFLCTQISTGSVPPILTGSCMVSGKEQMDKSNTHTRTVPGPSLLPSILQFIITELFAFTLNIALASPQWNQDACFWRELWPHSVRHPIHPRCSHYDMDPRTRFFTSNGHGLLSIWRLLYRLGWYGSKIAYRWLTRATNSTRFFIVLY